MAQVMRPIFLDFQVKTTLCAFQQGMSSYQF